MSIVSWQSEKIYYTAREYFSDLVAEIRQARHSIEVETYIFDMDKVGEQILAELVAASRRNVRVRLVVDGFGAFFHIAKIRETLLQTSVELKVFHPFFFTQIPIAKWLRLDLFLGALSHMNRRLHRKVCLIDGQALFVGSFNITDNANRETGIRLTGSQLSEVLEAFETIWRRGRGRSNLNKIVNRSGLVLLNDDRRLRKSNSLHLRERISSAKKRVWITNAYFVPPPRVLAAIVAARKNGVDVQVLVPSRPDPKFMKLLIETYYRGLLKIGVRIFEYQNDFLHAKTLLIDDWGLVGSSNLNHRSVFHDLEVDVVLSQQASILSLQNQFLLDQSKSTEMILATLLERPWFDRIFAWFVHSLRYWL